MSLGYDIARALPGLRAQAESRMADECRVENDLAPVWNEDKLDYDHIPATVYEGKCRIRVGETAARVGEQAGQVFTEVDAVLSLPFSDPATAGVVKGHTVTITASANDPALVGAVFKIRATRGQTDATARRFPLEVTQ